MLIDTSIRNSFAYENLSTSVVITGWRVGVGSMHRWAMYGGAGVQMGILVFISHWDLISSSVLLLYLQTLTNGISITHFFHINISTETVFNINTTELHPKVRPTNYFEINQVIK